MLFRGCRLADTANPDDYEFLEPALRGTGVHLKWFAEEYSTSSILESNLKFKRSENIEYYSIGSRCHEVEGLQLQYTHNKLYYFDRFIDTQNDGIICLDESKEGIKLIDLTYNHYDLLGLNGKLDDKLVTLYANHFKSLDLEVGDKDKAYLM